jgi:hypothetical protein
LVVAAIPSASAIEVGARLRDTTIAEPNLAGKIASGGRIDDAAALDLVAPDTKIDSGLTALTNDTTPSVAFSSNESRATFECRFDGAAFKPCSGPGSTHTPAPGLGGGAHSFAVRATDGAGNTDQTPASGALAIDAADPKTKIVKGPNRKVRTRGRHSTTKFRFSATDALARTAGAAGTSLTFECKVDDGKFKACSSTHKVKVRAGPKFKKHKFRVRAIDAAERVDWTPAKYIWRVRSRR